MAPLLAWVVANPAEAVGLAYAVLNALNAAIPPGKGLAGNAVHKARLALDWVSVLQAGRGKRPAAKTLVG